MKHASPQRSTALVCAVGAVIGAIGLIPLLFLDVAGRDAGITACSLLVLIAAPAAVISRRRARRAEQLLGGQGALARWAYTPQEAGAYLDGLLAEERKAGRRFLFVGGLLITGAAALFLALDPDGGRASLFAFFGVMLVLTAAAEFGPRLLRAERSKASPDAVVSPDAAYVVGTLYVWGCPSTRIRDAGVTPGEVPALRVAYVSPPLRGGGETAVLIPIPRGAEVEAAETARVLRERRDRDATRRMRSI